MSFPPLTSCGHTLLLRFHFTHEYRMQLVLVADASLRSFLQNKTRVRLCLGKRVQCVCVCVSVCGSVPEPQDAAAQPEPGVSETATGPEPDDRGPAAPGAP